MATGRVPTTANSPLTAKGDLFGYSTTQARVAVGSDGDTLVADSAASTGLRWQGNYAAGKNKIINGDFSIWQRGSSFSGTNQLVYTADRWLLNDFGGQVSSVARSTFTPGTAPVAGYEGEYYATWSRAGAGTASSYLQQKIENVRTFAGQTVTFSFYAKATATESVNFYIDQNFGSGGSATVGSALTTFTLTTSWVRYTTTVTLASISGKTVGTSSFIAPTFQVQTSQGAYTIDIWGVQLEAGSVATAFQTATGTIQGETALCQRYYYRVGGSNLYERFAQGYATSTTNVTVTFNQPITMRVAPTAIDYSTVLVADGVTVFTVTGLTIDQASRNVSSLNASVASGLTQFRPYGCGSNNSTSAYIGLSAEL